MRRWIRRGIVRPLKRAVAWAIVAVMTFTPLAWLIDGHRPDVRPGVGQGETVIKKP